MGAMRVVVNSEVPETATQAAPNVLRVAVGDAALRGLHSNQRTRWQRSSAPNAAAFIVKKAGVAD